jgi:hypothetical protein
MLTDYHAKYYAHELTKRRSSGSLEKLAGQWRVPRWISIRIRLMLPCSRSARPSQRELFSLTKSEHATIPYSDL